MESFKEQWDGVKAINRPKVIAAVICISGYSVRFSGWINKQGEIHQVVTTMEAAERKWWKNTSFWGVWSLNWIMGACMTYPVTYPTVKRLLGGDLTDSLGRHQTLRCHLQFTDLSPIFSPSQPSRSSLHASLAIYFISLFNSFQSTFIDYHHSYWLHTNILYAFHNA